MQIALKQPDRVDRDEGTACFADDPAHLAADDLVRDLVQRGKGGRVGKDEIAERFAVKIAVCKRFREARFQRFAHILVPRQQLVIELVAVDAETALRLDSAQEGRFSAAGAAGDSDDLHSSTSALTQRKAAAFFRRLPTA